MVSFTFSMNPNPSFLEGVARIADINGELNRSWSSEYDDEFALASDWCQVGRDFHKAIDRHARGNRKLAVKGSR